MYTRKIGKCTSCMTVVHEQSHRIPSGEMYNQYLGLYTCEVQMYTCTAEVIIPLKIFRIPCVYPVYMQIQLKMMIIFHQCPVDNARPVCIHCICRWHTRKMWKMGVQAYNYAMYKSNAYAYTKTSCTSYVS